MPERIVFVLCLLLLIAAIPKPHQPTLNHLEYYKFDRGVVKRSPAIA